MALSQAEDTCPHCHGEGGGHISRRGPRVITGPGHAFAGIQGSANGIRPELDRAVEESAREMARLFGHDVEIRCNSDGRSCGAGIDFPTKGQPAGVDMWLAIGVAAHPNHLPAYPSVPPSDKAHGRNAEEQAKWEELHAQWERTTDEMWSRYRRGEIGGHLTYDAIFPLAVAKDPKKFLHMDTAKDRVPWKQWANPSFHSLDEARRFMAENIDREKVDRLMRGEAIEGFSAPHWTGYPKHQGKLERRYYHENFGDRGPPGIYFKGAYDEVTTKPSRGEVRENRALPIAFDASDARALIEHRQPFVFIYNDPERALEAAKDGSRLSPFVEVDYDDYYDPQRSTRMAEFLQKLMPYEQALHEARQARKNVDSPYRYLYDLA